MRACSCGAGTDECSVVVEREGKGCLKDTNDRKGNGKKNRGDAGAGALARMRLWLQWYSGRVAAVATVGWGPCIGGGVSGRAC